MIKWEIKASEWREINADAFFKVQLFFVHTKKKKTLNQTMHNQKAKVYLKMSNMYEANSFISSPSVGKSFSISLKKYLWQPVKVNWLRKNSNESIGKRS